MKTKLPSILLGLVLILAGVFALLNQFGYLDELTNTTWLLIFAASSLLFFVAYFVSGIQNWGWLFPACIFAALTGTMAIVETGVAEEWIATLIVGSAAVPFVVAFLLDRSRWWALIPAFILGFVAIIPGLTTWANDEWIGAMIVAAIGLPFIVVYLIAPKNWWAIIPGGVMVSIALMILLSQVQVGIDGGGLGVTLMFLGWAITFGILWFRRSLYGTDWAKYPALALLGVALLMAFVTSGLQFIWSIALILAGLVMVLFSLINRRKPTQK